MAELLGPVMERLSGLGQRGLVLGAGLVAVVAVLLIASWGGGPAWVPIMGAVPLDRMGQVTQTLEEAGIEYRLAAGGARVEVAEADLARARVELASQGLPGQGGPGFELFDQPAWGMTDFTQRINYRRALEGELERTIRDMEGVESARVHLALQQSSVLRRSGRPAEASVVVRLRSGARPSGGLVEGMAFLVASSVDELSSEHVTVLDHTGRLLSRSVEDEPSLGLTTRQLDLRSRVESYLEQKAEALVGDMVGPGNVRVRIAADLNLERVDRTVQSVNPDQQLVEREERTEITPGPEDVGAASVAYKTDYDATRSVEHFVSAGGDTRRLSVAVLVNDAGETVRSPADLDRIEALVAAAIGLDRERGDVISVVGVPFEGGLPLTPEAPRGPGIWELVGTLQRPVLTVLALLIAFALGLRAIRAVAAPRSGRRALPAGGAGEAGAEEAAASLAADAGLDGGMLVKGPATAGSLEDKGARLRKQLSAAQAQRMQEVTVGVMERPELAARVVQAWLKS